LALACLALVWLVRAREDAGRTRRFVLLLVACSMFPQHNLYFYGEPFSALTAMLGMVALPLGRHVLGWGLLTLGVANTPALLPAMGLVALATSWQERRLRHLVAPLAPLLLIFVENLARRGNLLSFGYDEAFGAPGRPQVMPYSHVVGFDYPLLLGLAGLLLSFGRGVLFYAPGLWLLPAQKNGPGIATVLERASFLWLLFLLGMLLTYAKWHQWHGAVFWGPRFFLFASVPASWLLVRRLEAKGLGPGGNFLTGLVLAASAWVGANAVFYRLGDVPHSVCRWAEGSACIYAPEASPLAVPFVFSKRWEPELWPLLGLCAATALWLATPLLRTLAVQTREAASGWVRRAQEGDWRV
ncbi:MAG: hypothetical protein L0Y66_14695, partial [Myxococcaceae bacterium]|nr:hypothetical protein [Myxococcaceae bacterium]